MTKVNEKQEKNMYALVDSFTGAVVKGPDSSASTFSPQDLVRVSGGRRDLHDIFFSSIEKAEQEASRVLKAIPGTVLYLVEVGSVCFIPIVGMETKPAVDFIEVIEEEKSSKKRKNTKK